jgi:hypothetical protein
MRKLCLISVLMLACPWIAAAQGPAIGANVLSQTSFGSPVTLEAGPDYTGFLQCADTVLHPNFKHQDNQGALTNPLKKPALTHTAVIVGHGHPGLVCTSNGIDCYLPDQSMNTGNYKDWATWAGAWPNKFHSLTILACDTGSGRDGAQFLQQMADAVKMPVRGPTDFIWCKNPDGIVLDQNAQWQEATPGTPGTPAPKPISPKFRPYAAMTPETKMMLSTDGGVREVPFGSVDVVSFSTRPVNSPSFQELNPTIVRSLVAKINFSEPLKTSYVPDATVTAQFKLRINLPNGPSTKHFVVLNDRLINDSVDRTIYYRTSSSFTEQLQGLRR